jgi:hypothetical protein
VWQAEGHMPFGNFGACCTVTCLAMCVGPAAYLLTASVINFAISVGAFSVNSTNVVFVSLAPGIVEIIASVASSCAICRITSRNRTSIRNKLNLKVRGF